MKNLTMNQHMKKFEQELLNTKDKLMRFLEEKKDDLAFMRRETWGSAHANYIRSYSEDDKNILIKVEEEIDSLRKYIRQLQEQINDLIENWDGTLKDEKAWYAFYLKNNKKAA